MIVFEKRQSTMRTVSNYTSRDGPFDMEEIVESVVIFVKLVFWMVYGSLRALLPAGILPRKSVQGDVCLITGAGNGIGRLMAIEFAKLGCTMVLLDINTKWNEETKSILGKTGAKVYTYTVDLSKREAINETAALVKKDVGRVDILVNNAGIVTGKKIFECPDELMEKTMAVNCSANLFLAKNFVPGMIERNHGHIVTIASMAGKAGVAGLVDYCASKHGAVGFHESLTAELQYLKADGVKTTVVCPYYIDTGMFDGVETMSPTFLPILQPEFVSSRIMDAVLTDRESLYLPKFAYLIAFGISFLPVEASSMVATYLGVNRNMDHFKGRKGKAA